MRAIFIADAHLGRPTDANYQLLLRFLAELPGTIDLLVIAGDFFEFWLGNAAEPFPHYRPVLESLAAITGSGTKLVFIEGNHDFHLKRYFRETFNADVHPDQALLTLDNRRLLVCHGDLLNPADYGYRLLRLLFRNPFTYLLSCVLPSAVPAWIADRLGRHSKEHHGTVAGKWDGRQLVRNFAARQFAAGVDVVVTAHYHIPFMEQEGGNRLLALGDWITQFSYGEWRDGELTLKRYPG